MLKNLQPVPEDSDSLEARIVSLVIDLGNTVLTKRAAGELHGYVGRSRA